MKDRKTIEYNFKHSSDYRRCPESWRLTELEVLLDIRDLLLEMNERLKEETTVRTYKGPF